MEQVAVGDILIIKPSDQIAMDGEIVTGASSVDESTITGEPLPKDKHPGDQVFAGTLNKQGYLEVRVTRAAQDSTLAKIVAITFQATKNKADTQKFIEKFSAYYTPAIIVIATLLVMIPVLLYGQPFDKWFREALTLLIIACPCALVISTPISIYSAIGNASARGALVKGGKYIEAIGRVAVVAMDKTRTLTYGKPVITDVVPFGDATREHLLACAAGIELYSEHPLAQSIVEGARNEGLTPHGTENFRAILGKGAKADCVVCYDRHHCIGKLAFITEEHHVQQEVTDKVEELQRQGRTSIVISSSKEVEGIIAVTDEIKPESKAAIAEMRRLGVKTAMLTGDHRVSAEQVAVGLGIDEWDAELLPEDKVRLLRETKDALRVRASRTGWGRASERGVAFIGDGVNDAPALSAADVAIGIGSIGSDAALESSDIVLLNDDLECVPWALALARRARAILRFNIIAAMSVIVVMGLWTLIGSRTGLAVEMWQGVIAHEGGTLLVVLNSLRLLWAPGVEHDRGGTGEAARAAPPAPPEGVPALAPAVQ